MNPGFYLIITVFLILFILIFKIRRLSFKILELVKEKDRDKWNRLVSCGKAEVLFKPIIWFNPIRFEKFISSDDNLGSLSIQILKKRYKLFKKILFILFFIIMVFLIGILVIMTVRQNILAVTLLDYSLYRPLTS
jgi:hypothetical protein